MRGATPASFYKETDMILYEGDTFEKDGVEYIIRLIDASDNKFEVRAEPKPRVCKSRLCWWFNPKLGKVEEGTDAGSDWMKVTPEYAEYLRNKPEGEWELRKHKRGDGIVTYPVQERLVCEWEPHPNETPDDRGYRWCKPKAGWRVYDVVVRNGEDCIAFAGDAIATLDVAMREHGKYGRFGGVQFEGQRVDCWSMSICACIDKDGYMPTFAEDDEVPAVPIRARFWETQ
jgi:hypothetical protein